LIADVLSTVVGVVDQAGYEIFVVVEVLACCCFFEGELIEPKAEEEEEEEEEVVGIEGTVGFNKLIGCNLLFSSIVSFISLF